MEDKSSDKRQQEFDERNVISSGSYTGLDHQNILVSWSNKQEFHSWILANHVLSYLEHFFSLGISKKKKAYISTAGFQFLWSNTIAHDFIYMDYYLLPEFFYETLPRATDSTT